MRVFVCVCVCVCVLCCPKRHPASSQKPISAVPFCYPVCVCLVCQVCPSISPCGASCIVLVYKLCRQKIKIAWGQEEGEEEDEGEGEGEAGGVFTMDERGRGTPGVAQMR